MASHRHEQRTAGRRCAVQILYTSELQNRPASELLDEGLVLFEDELSPDGVIPEYALDLVRGVEEHCEDIDRILASAVENWTVSRMPVVDRSILRVAIYEMVYEERVPVSVAINEAVELAKAFGGEDESPRFANGVLGRISQQLDAGAAAVAAGRAADACEGSIPEEGVPEAGAKEADARVAVDSQSNPADACAAAGFEVAADAEAIGAQAGSADVDAAADAGADASDGSVAGGSPREEER